jgi:hypothetical protein
MSASERLLSPECRCGKTMRLAEPGALPLSHETHVNVYVCRTCGHEMRVTVWGTDVQAPEPAPMWQAGFTGKAKRRSGGSILHRTP